MTLLCLVNYLYQFPWKEGGKANYHTLFLGPGGKFGGGGGREVRQSGQQSEYFK